MCQSAGLLLIINIIIIFIITQLPSKTVNFMVCFHGTVLFNIPRTVVTTSQAMKVCMGVNALRCGVCLSLVVSTLTPRVLCKYEFLDSMFFVFSGIGRVKRLTLL